MKNHSRYPFPGMDPWLENPDWWVSFHHELVTDMARDLCAKLTPRYTAKYGTRLVVETPVERNIYPDVVISRRRAGPVHGYEGEAIDPAVTLILPDDEREEAWIEVRTTGRTGRVVTILEVLSPGNKRSGTDAAQKYRQKQEEVLASEVHLVEIDLLRGGEHVAAIPLDGLDRLRPYDCLTVVRRASPRHHAQVYATRLRDRLPRIPVPLLSPDPDAALDLQAMVEHVYAAGAYWNLIDYSRPPAPPLARADLRWARSLLSARKR
ncbi:MAG: DUF4058 family protein [Planctomycetes bacterium]|nr:DUF4058 family protein [Planctomycetota bacterium]